MSRNGPCVPAIALAAAMMASGAWAADFADAPGGVVRWLDKITGEVGDLELQRGQSAENGRLVVQLDACRYPTDNPAAEAEAHLTILDMSLQATVFSGWMLASSPALSAMEHPRYDVWVLRCMTP